MLNLKFLKVLETFDIFWIISIIYICCLIFYMFINKFLHFLQNRSAIFYFQKKFDCLFCLKLFPCADVPPFAENLLTHWPSSCLQAARGLPELRLT